MLINEFTIRTIKDETKRKFGIDFELLNIKFVKVDKMCTISFKYKTKELFTTVLTNREEKINFTRVQDKIEKEIKTYEDFKDSYTQMNSEIYIINNLELKYYEEVMDIREAFWDDYAKKIIKMVKEDKENPIYKDGHYYYSYWLESFEMDEFLKNYTGF